MLSSEGTQPLREKASLNQLLEYYLSGKHQLLNVRVPPPSSTSSPRTLLSDSHPGHMLPKLTRGRQHPEAPLTYLDSHFSLPAGIFPPFPDLLEDVDEISTLWHLVLPWLDGLLRFQLEITNTPPERRHQFLQVQEEMQASRGLSDMCVRRDEELLSGMKVVAPIAGREGVLDKVVKVAQDDRTAPLDPEAAHYVRQMYDFLETTTFRTGYLAAPPYSLVVMRAIPSTGTLVISPNAVAANEQSDFMDPEAWRRYMVASLAIQLGTLIMGSERIQKEVIDLGHQQFVEDVVRFYGEAEFKGKAPGIPLFSQAGIGSMQGRTLLSLWRLVPPSMGFQLIGTFRPSPDYGLSVVHERSSLAYGAISLKPDSVHERLRNNIFVYPDLGIVIKYYHGGKRTDEYKKELTVLQALSSLGFVPSIIATGETLATSAPFIIMTYHGDQKSDYMTQKELDSVFRDLVDPMHKAGWHHHDLKHDNVLWDSNGKRFIIDFEWAVPASECRTPFCPDAMAHGDPSAFWPNVS